MWRSGMARRRREAALAEMLSVAERRGSYHEPWHAVASVWDHFRDESDILRSLQAQWWTELAGAIYVAIDAGQGNLVEDVTRAYHKTERRHQALRRVLEVHASHPAIDAAMRKERALLSSFSGVLPSSDKAPAATVAA